MATPRTPAPLHATPRTRRPSIGPAVADMVRTMGVELMPWQKRVADVAGELNPDGSFAHPEIVVTVPRQAGKTTLVRGEILTRLDRQDFAKSVYIPQSGPAGRVWWRDLARDLHRTRWGRSFKVRHALGDEVLTWGPTASTLHLLPPTESAGHGMTIDQAVGDELWRQKDFRLPQALLPAQITRPLRQTWWISTAGTPESVLLKSLVDQGRSMVDDPDAPVALFEWGAPEDADPTKRATWRMAHPALGHTVPVEAIEHAFQTMELEEFRRAFLNQWVDQREARQIPLEAWLACAVDVSAVPPAGSFWLAFDVSPLRDGAAIGVAARLEDGTVAVELVDYLRNPHAVAGRVLELVAQHRPVKVIADGAGPAGTVVDVLQDRLGERLEVLNGRQYSRACTSFYDDLMAGLVKVHAGPELDGAAGAATRRPLGDGWAWGRARSAGDISPLVAVTLAAYGARLYEPAPKPRVYAPA